MRASKNSIDTSVVCFPEKSILFGGCFTKSMESKDLGNIKESNIVEWPNSIKRMFQRFRNVQTVVPGHGNFGEVDLIQHTADLLKNKVTEQEPWRINNER